jgi:ABC-type multidrug transport system fused ATPase/permease subunit
LITLLERWYDPSSGRILVDNQCEIKAMNLKWWRQSLGLVQQEPTLFGVSLRDNIAVGVDHVATDAEIEQAAKAANAFDFIKALPQSFDTMIGESGSEQLSGGQKQRVAIARAMYVSFLPSLYSFIMCVDV